MKEVPNSVWAVLRKEIALGFVPCKTFGTALSVFDALEVGLCWGRVTVSVSACGSRGTEVGAWHRLKCHTVLGAAARALCCCWRRWLLRLDHVSALLLTLEVAMF